MKFSETTTVNGRTVYLKRYINYGETKYTVYTAKRWDPNGKDRNWVKGYVSRQPSGNYVWRLVGRGYKETKWHGVYKTRKEAIAALLVRVDQNKRAAASRRKNAKCTCRAPNRHNDCQYCGVGWWGEVVCGVCHEQGIDGKVIRGTERRVCKQHREKQAAKQLSFWLQEVERELEPIAT